MVLSGLLVSTLALWTPLWSTINRTDEELQWSGKDSETAPLPGDLWSDISQYKLTRPMNILVMGIEPVPNSVDGSPKKFFWQKRHNAANPAKPRRENNAGVIDPQRHDDFNS